MSLRIYIHNSRLSAQINYSGAELGSVKDTEGIEFIWQADPQVWPRHAPVLFPIVGKLKDNRFFLNGEQYELLQHGFARDKEFELVEQKKDSCRFRLVPDKEIARKFPQDFIFEIAYELKENRLTTQYAVQNPSGETLYFSVGAHPGFKCPILPAEKPEDYYLLFEKDEYLITELENGLRRKEKTIFKPKERKLALTKQLFDKDALVFEGNQIDKISLCSSKSRHKIELDCSGWPYFGIWAKPGQPFVCLEPWYGVADAVGSTQQLNEKEGIIALGPEKKFQCSFTLTFF